MKRWLLALILSLIAASAMRAVAQDTSQPDGEEPEVPTFIQRTFNLAEAYPCTAGTYDAGLGISDPGVFTGRGPVVAPARGAVPGILSLRRRGLVLDVNCFAIIPPGQTGPCFVQSYRLRKVVPGSNKCPDVYGAFPRTYFQFSGGVRTWWSLNFTQPGTQFFLEVVSVCRGLGPTGSFGPRVHRDTWVWTVVADVNTLEYVIELMHTGAISTLEIPCILGEDMYDALKNARQRLAQAISTDDLTQIGNAIFDMEALIVANCLFIEALHPVQVFRGPDQFGAPNFQPPGNLARTVEREEGGTAVAGIIDTVEHPCCCKLLVDLEWITIQLGLGNR